MTPEEIASRFFNVDANSLHATRIKSGLTNESYRVTGGHENIVVRISNADEQSLQINRNSEAVVLKLVEQAGIGASVLFNQPEAHILITRELHGRNLTVEEMGNAANVKRIARLLQRLHSLSVTQPVQSTQLEKVLRGYWQSLGEWRDQEQALNIARESDQQSIRCLCHNDVHHLNLVDEGECLWLVDWEYAGIGDPYFDLASVCCYHGFDELQYARLLKCYHPSLKSADQLRLQRMCWLFDYIKELWFAVRNG